MALPLHPPAAFVETPAGEVYVEGAEEVTGFTFAFEYLRAAAVSVEESR
jgi:hypothetical protein